MAKVTYIEVDHEIIPSGEFPVVDAQNIQCVDERLDEVLREIGNSLETLEGLESANETNVATNTSAISGLDSRVTILEEQGGGGGTSDYASLTNKPQINGNVLSGNKTSAQLGLASASDIPGDYITGGSQTSTSSADGGSNVFTFTNANGTTSTFTVNNGSKGSQGVQGEKGEKGDTGPQGPAGQNATTTAVATTTSNGLMSYNDKTTLNSLNSKIYRWFSSGNCSLLSGDIYVIGAQIHIDCVVTCKWAVSQYWDLVKLPFNIKSPAGSGNRYTNTTAGYYITDNSAQIMANKAFAKSDTITLNLVLTKYGFITS